MESCQDARLDLVEKSFENTRLVGVSYLLRILARLRSLVMSFCCGAKWLVSNCWRCQISLSRSRRKIVFPLMGSGLAAVGVLTFLFSWSDYLFVVVLTSSNAIPVMVGAADFVTSYGVRWGDIPAAVFLSVLPLLIFATAAQKYLVKGLSSGALKG